MINLIHRSNKLELMDDLECSGPVVDQTLRELDVINRKLGGNQISLNAFRYIIKRRTPMKLEVADLGCGGGDILINLAKWGEKRGLDLSLVGVDANPHIIRYADKHCEAFKNISFEVLDIFSEEFANKQYDIIHCSLFLHHFSNENLIRLFSQFKRQARIGIIVNDLHRHFLAYYSIKWITKLFSRSFMIQNDAALSVARGFRRLELIEILKEAGLSDYQLSWQWAFRWKLIWLNPEITE